MKRCILVSDEVKNLSKELKIDDLQTCALIGLWQDFNDKNIDEYPSNDELQKFHKSLVNKQDDFFTKSGEYIQYTDSQHKLIYKAEKMNNGNPLYLDANGDNSVVYDKFLKQANGNVAVAMLATSMFYNDNPNIDKTNEKLSLVQNTIDIYNLELKKNNTKTIDFGGLKKYLLVGETDVYMHKFWSKEDVKNKEWAEQVYNSVNSNIVREIESAVNTFNKINGKIEDKKQLIDTLVNQLNFANDNIQGKKLIIRTIIENIEQEYEDVNDGFEDADIIPNISYYRLANIANNVCWQLTGLVKGFDGKWRKEVDDIKFDKETEQKIKDEIARQLENNDTIGITYNLRDLISKNSPLYDIVRFTSLGSYTIRIFSDLNKYFDGVCNPLNKEIGLNILGGLTRSINDINTIYDSILSTINHECQHALQNYFGFAQGTDIKKISYNDYNKFDAAIKLLVDNNIIPQEKGEEYKNIFRDNSEQAKENNEKKSFLDSFILHLRLLCKNEFDDYFNSIENNLDDLNDSKNKLINKIKNSPSKNFKDKFGIENIEDVDKLYNEWKEFHTKKEFVLDTVNRLIFENNFDWKLYSLAGGEVESRNIETRMSLSDEQKKNTSPINTEDNIRENQYSPNGNNGMSNSISTTNSSNSSNEYTEQASNELNNSPEIVYTNEQLEAINKCVNWLNRETNVGEFYTFIGKAGTGKTTCAKRIIQLYRQAHPYDPIVMGALSWKATDVLEKSVNDKRIKFSSIASTFGYTPQYVKDQKTGETIQKFGRDADFEEQVRNKKRFPPISWTAKLIVIDECSMVSKEQLDLIIKDIEKHNPSAKLLFLGDDGQLNPIGEDNISETFSRYGEDNHSRLKTRMRQGEGNPILEYADTYWNNSHEKKENMHGTRMMHIENDNINTKGGIVVSDNEDSQLDAMATLYQKQIDEHNPNIVKFVTRTNEKVQEINEKIHKKLFPNSTRHFEKGEYVFLNEQVDKDFRNGCEYRILSCGDIDDFLGVKYQKLTIVNNEGIEKEVNIQIGDFKEEIDKIYHSNPMVVKQFIKLGIKKGDNNYAITCHKAQGSTYEVTFVDEDGMEMTSAGESSRMIYTALTRSKNLTVVITKVGNQTDKNVVELNDSINANKNKPQQLQTISSSLEPKFKGKMTYSYGNEAREGLKSKTTLEAIKNGERTATTRYEKDGNIDYWKQAKVGDIIEFEGANGEKVKVRVTKELHKLDYKDFYYYTDKEGKDWGDGREWSKLEGWNDKHFNNKVLPEIKKGTAWQMEFEYVPETTTTQQSTTQSNNEVVTIDYTPEGKSKQTYTIKGTHIFNKDNKEVFIENSADRNKIFANLAVKQGRAVVVDYKDSKYVVNNKNAIISVTSGEIMQWGEENGNRKAILELAKQKFTEKIVNDIANKVPTTTIQQIGKEGIANTIKTINDNNELSEEEKKNAEKLIGSKRPKIMIASEHTDPVFHASQIKKIVEENKKLDKNDPNKFHAMYLITKHDGLPLKELASLKIPKFIHFSITSLGGTKYEPGVMKYNDMLDRIGELVKDGSLNPSLITIRIDPIVPGVTNFEDIRNIVNRAKSFGIKQFKFSVMDSYGYTSEGNRSSNTKDRYILQKMTELGYDWETYYGKSNGVTNFDAKPQYIQEIYTFMDKLVEEVGGIIMQTCGEQPKGLDLKHIRTHSGCVNVDSINAALGTNNVENVQGHQRKECSCYGNTADVLKYTDKCASSCVYCYAGHNSDAAVKYYNEDGTLKDNVFTRTSENPTTQTTSEQPQLQGVNSQSSQQKLYYIANTYLTNTNRGSKIIDNIIDDRSELMKAITTKQYDECVEDFVHLAINKLLDNGEGSIKQLVLNAFTKEDGILKQLEDKYNSSNLYNDNIKLDNARKDVKLIQDGNISALATRYGIGNLIQDLYNDYCDILDDSGVDDNVYGAIVDNDGIKDIINSAMYQLSEILGIKIKKEDINKIYNNIINEEILDNSSSVITTDGESNTVSEDGIENDKDDVMDGETAYEKYSNSFSGNSEISQHDSISKTTRRILGNIIDKSAGKNFYGRPKYINPATAHTILLNILSNIIDEEDMLDALEESVKLYPWVQDIIDRISFSDKGEAENYQRSLIRSVFFKDFFKQELQYIEHKNMNGTLVPIVCNKAAVDEYWRPIFETSIKHIKDSKDFLFKYNENGDVVINKDNEFVSEIKDKGVTKYKFGQSSLLLKLESKFAELDGIESTEEYAEKALDILNDIFHKIFCVDFNEQHKNRIKNLIENSISVSIVDGKAVINDRKSSRERRVSCSNFLNNIFAELAKFDIPLDKSVSLFSGNNAKVMHSLFTKLGPVMGNVNEASVRCNGKMYYAYAAPNAMDVLLRVFRAKNRLDETKFKNLLQRNFMFKDKNGEYRWQENLCVTTRDEKGNITSQTITNPYFKMLVYGFNDPDTKDGLTCGDFHKVDSVMSIDKFYNELFKMSMLLTKEDKEYNEYSRKDTDELQLTQFYSAHSSSYNNIPMCQLTIPTPSDAMQMDFISVPMYSTDKIVNLYAPMVRQEMQRINMVIARRDARIKYEKEKSDALKELEKYDKKELNESEKKKVSDLNNIILDAETKLKGVLTTRNYFDYSDKGVIYDNDLKGKEEFVDDDFVNREDGSAFKYLPMLNNVRLGRDFFTTDNIELFDKCPNILKYIQGNEDKLKDHSFRYILQQYAMSNKDVPNISSETDIFISHVVGNILDQMFNKYLAKLKNDGVFETKTNDKGVASFSRLRSIFGVKIANLDNKLFEVRKNTNINYGINDKIIKELRTFYYNSLMGNQSLVQLFSSDIAFYGNLTNFQKRWKEYHSPSNKINLSAQDPKTQQPLFGAETIIDNLGNEIPNPYRGMQKSITIRDQEIFSNSLKALDNHKEGEENITMKSPLEDILVQSMDRAGINSKEGNGGKILKNILKEYSEVNVTDAQAYRSLESYRKICIACGQGKWTEQAENAYQAMKEMDRIGNLQNKTEDDLKKYEEYKKQFNSNFFVLFQTLKPFAFGRSNMNVGVDETTQYNISMPRQHKNSEFILMSAIISSGLLHKNNKLRAIHKFMQDNDIDLVEFDSAVKVGQGGVVKLDQTGDKDISYEEYYKRLNDACKTSNDTFNEYYVQIEPFENYGIQVETPEHFIDKSQMLGTQIKKLITSNMRTDGLYEIPMPNGDSKTFTKDELITHYQALITTTMVDEANGILEELNGLISIDGKKVYGYIDENGNKVKCGEKEAKIRTLQRLFKKEVEGNPRYGKEIEDALELVGEGDNLRFRLPLWDDIQSTRIQQFLCSMVKSRTTKLQTKGGALIQVSCYGTTDELNIRYNDNNGYLIFTEEEFISGKGLDDNQKSVLKDLKSKLRQSIEADADVHREMSKDKNKFEPTWSDYVDYLKNNATSKDGHYVGSVAYMECYMPCYSQEILNIPGIVNKETGIIDINKLPIELRKCIGYRTPTEDIHSMCPLYIKGFLPYQNGSAIMLPSEITKLSGSDFDVDKLYIMRPEFWIDQLDHEEFNKFVRKSNEYETIKNVYLEYKYPNDVRWEEVKTEKDGTDTKLVFNSLLNDLYNKYYEGEKDKPKIGKFIYDYNNNENYKKLVIAKIGGEEELSKLEEKHKEKIKNIYEDLNNFIYKLLNDRNSLPEEEQNLVDDSEIEDLKKLYKENKKNFKTKANIKYVEYNHKKSEANNTREARMNELLNCMFGILQNKDSFLRFVKPGGFEKQKQDANITKLMVYIANHPSQREGIYKKLGITKRSDLYNLDKCSKKISEVLSEFDVDLSSPISPDVRTELLHKNMEGKELLQVFAINNSSHAMFQSFLRKSMRLHSCICGVYKINNKQLNGVHDQYPIDIKTGNILNYVDDNYSNEMNIIDNMASYLAGSADNAKDPWLGDLGFNMTTVNVGVILARAGYSSLEIGYILNQPIVKEIVRQVENGKNQNTVIKNLIDNYGKANNLPENYKYIDLLANENFTLDYLERHFSDKVDNNDSDNVQFGIDQMKVLLLYKDLLDNSQALSELTIAYRCDTMGGASGPTIADNKDKVNKIIEFENKPDNLIQMDINGQPYIETFGGHNKHFCKIVTINFNYRALNNIEFSKLGNDFVNYDSYDKDKQNKMIYMSNMPFMQCAFETGIHLSEKILEDNFSKFDNNYEFLKNGLLSRTTNISNKLIDKFNSDLQMFKLRRLPFFKEKFVDNNGNATNIFDLTAQAKFVKTFPQIFEEYKQKHSNKFIDRIGSVINENLGEDGVDILQFNNVGKIDTSEKAQIINDWENMIYGSEEDFNIAIGLYVYGVYRCGNKFHPTGWSNLVPTKIKEVIDGYIDCEYQNYDKNDIGFINQFLCNNINEDGVCFNYWDGKITEEKFKPIISNDVDGKELITFAVDLKYSEDGTKPPTVIEPNGCYGISKQMFVKRRVGDVYKYYVNIQNNVIYGGNKITFKEISVPTNKTTFEWYSTDYESLTYGNTPYLIDGTDIVEDLNMYNYLNVIEKVQRREGLLLKDKEDNQTESDKKVKQDTFDFSIEGLATEVNDEQLKSIFNYKRNNNSINNLC